MFTPNPTGKITRQPVVWRMPPERPGGPFATCRKRRSSGARNRLRSVWSITKSPRSPSPSHRDRVRPEPRRLELSRLVQCRRQRSPSRLVRQPLRLFLIRLFTRASRWMVKSTSTRFTTAAATRCRWVAVAVSAFVTERAACRWADATGSVAPRAVAATATRCAASIAIAIHCDLVSRSVGLKTDGFQPSI